MTSSGDTNKLSSRLEIETTEDTSTDRSDSADWPSSVALRSLSLSGIFLILLIASLHFASAILIPITIAYSLNLLLSPVIRRFSNVKIPPPLSAAVVVFILVSLLAASVYSLFEPAESWVKRAPSVIKEIKVKLDPVLGSIAGAQNAADNVDALMEDAQEMGTQKFSIEVAPQESRLERMLDNMSSAIGSIGIVIVLLYFLLAAGDSFLGKLVSILPKFEDKRRAVEITRDIQRDISRYLTVRTLINIGLGVVISLVLFWLDMPNPWLWGALAALLNFAPYVGPAISLSLITIASVISYDSIAQALVVPAAVLLINILEGEFVSHQLIGKRLSLSPVIVFLSIVFWGWLWGVAGALLAIPILAAINVISQHIESMRPLSEFIRSK